MRSEYFINPFQGIYCRCFREPQPIRLPMERLGCFIEALRAIINEILEENSPKEINITAQGCIAILG